MHKLGSNYHAMFRGNDINLQIVLVTIWLLPTCFVDKINIQTQGLTAWDYLSIFGNDHFIIKNTAFGQIDYDRITCTIFLQTEQYFSIVHFVLTVAENVLCYC